MAQNVADNVIGKIPDAIMQRMIREIMSHESPLKEVIIKENSYDLTKKGCLDVSFNEDKKSYQLSFLDRNSILRSVEISIDRDNCERISSLVYRENNGPKFEIGGAIASYVRENVLFFTCGSTTIFDDADGSISFEL